MASSSPKTALPPASCRSIDDALAGLDRAERLRRRGRWSEALALYEENIGAMIGSLKSMPDENGRGVDKSVLADRVRIALDDAEATKRALRGNHGNGNGTGNGNGNGNVGGAPTKGMSRERTPTSRLSDAFSSMLGVGKSQRYGANRCTEAPQTVTPQSQTIKDAGPSHATSQRRKRSHLNYAADDPLVQVVKKELYVDKSRLSTRWDDAVGLRAAKRALQEAAVLPLLRPDLYTGLRSPARGVLLYGPPGTGKTMLVRASAKESKCLLFSCTASALTSRWHGESEKLLRTLFAVAVDAAPSIIFFDEIDALLASRRGDGNEHEDAVMRRMNRRIYVPLPDKEARKFLLNKLLSKESCKHSLSKKQIDSIADRTEGYSCSDISALAQEAAFGPLRDIGSLSDIEHCCPDDVRGLRGSDFDEALENTKPALSNELMKRYEVWEDQQK